MMAVMLRFREHKEHRNLGLKPQEFGAEPIELGLRAQRRGTDWLVLPFLKGLHQAASGRWGNIHSTAAARVQNPHWAVLVGSLQRRTGASFSPLPLSFDQCSIRKTPGNGESGPQNAEG